MKKAILHACVMSLLSFALPGFGQITLERSDYTLTTDGAIIKSWEMSLANVSIPEEGTDITWDFSTQALTFSFEYVKVPVSEPQFPDANLLENSSGLALNIVAQGLDFYEQLDDEGYKVLGRVSEPLTLPSQPLTGGPNDTISFLGSVSVYEEPNFYLKFPMTYQDSWTSEHNIGGNYLMTVGAFGLDHVPASSNYHYAKTSEVVGYGTLILPHPDGAGTVSMEALLVKATTVRTDSFYLAGQPAPPVMLNVLGLQQGNVTTYSYHNFYAKGLIRSALSIDSQGGQVTDIAMADDVKNIVSSTRIVAKNLVDTKVFPNPASGDFQVNFEKPDANTWTFELYNPLGQMIFSKQLEGAAGKTYAGFSLPQTTASGLHHFALRNAEGVVMSNGHLMVK